MTLSNLSKYFFISFFLFYSGISFAGVKFFQLCKIEKNGSINITMTYSSKESEISAGKVGNLPFEINAVKQFFSSSESEIKKSLVYKDPKDETVTGVTVDIFIRDFNKFSDIKGLNSFKSKWLSKGDEMEFSLLVPATFFKDNLIDSYQFHLLSDDKIISSNGVIENNLCKWYVTKENLNPGGAYFLTSVSASEENKSNISESEKNNSSGENSSDGLDNVPGGDPDSQEKGKCGVFSIELPFVLLLGIIASEYGKRRIRK